MKTEQSLIFLHGGPGFKDYLEPYFQGLKESFNCQFYDQLRGPKVILEDLLIQLNEKVKESAQPILIGHSWGGVLATEFALRHQERLGGLIIMSSALSCHQWLAYRQDLKERNLEGAPPEEIFLVPADSGLGKIFLEKTWTTFSEETFDSLHKSYIERFDLTKKLNQVRIKFLNIYGEGDLRIPPRIAAEIHSCHSSIINHQIPEAGHFPFLQEAGRNRIFQILKETEW